MIEELTVTLKTSEDFPPNFKNPLERNSIEIKKKSFMHNRIPSFATKSIFQTGNPPIISEIVLRVWNYL